MDNFAYDEKIPPNTWVVLNIVEKSAYANLVVYYENELGVKNGDLIMCLGEISNQSGHCLMVHGVTRQVIGAFHADLFRLPTDDEL